MLFLIKEFANRAITEDLFLAAAYTNKNKKPTHKVYAVKIQ